MLWAWRVYKCKPFLGAKGAQSCTGLPISTFLAVPYSVVNGNSRTFTTLPSPVQRLHKWKAHIIKKLRAWRVRNVNHFLVQKANKSVRAGQYLRLLQRRIEPSMEIRVHSRPSLAQYKVCTNERCILSRSYGPEKFKNVNPFSVHRAHKAVHAWQYLRPLQRPIEQSMEIRVHSRPFLARYKGCTNARCLLSRSYGHEEFKNVNPFSVQKAHKAVQACQYLRTLLRGIVPSMEILVHSRPFQARYKGCTNARCTLSRSYGLEEYKNVNLSLCKRRTKLYRPANISVRFSAV